MIDLKVDNTKCELKASGSSGKLGIEILIASHALTETFAESLGTSFESAALLIMQSNNAVYRKKENEKSANSD